MKESIKIAQLSDLHICADSSAKIHGINPYKNLLRAINDLKTREIDLVLLTGDNSEDGSCQSYRLIGEAFSTVNLPIYAIPGNHDDPKNMAKILSSFKINLKKIHEISKDWRIIFLNSKVLNEHWGNLEQSELDFLEYSLKNLDKKNTLVCLHHHPISIQSPWMDKYMLKNNDNFLKILMQNSNIKLVIFGHIHQEFDALIKNIRFLSAPSTHVQFQPGAISRKFDEKTPGYRYFILNEDKFNTQVVRLTQENQ